MCSLTGPLGTFRSCLAGRKVFVLATREKSCPIGHMAQLSPGLMSHLRLKGVSCLGVPVLSLFHSFSAVELAAVVAAQNLCCAAIWIESIPWCYLLAQVQWRDPIRGNSSGDLLWD